MLSGMVQAVSDVCLPVLPCHLLGNCRRCLVMSPFAFSDACLSHVSEFLAKTGSSSNPLPHSCFHSFVLPLLEYCSPVWMSATDSNLNVLSKIVRSAGFLFPGNSNYDLDHRRNISSLCLFHKIYFNDDHPLHHLIPDPYVPSRQTRFSNQHHQYSVCEARCNTVQFQRSFFPYSAKLWNGLQLEVVDECMVKFKTACNRTLKWISL